MWVMFVVEGWSCDQQVPQEKDGRVRQPGRVPKEKDGLPIKIPNLDNRPFPPLRS
jgi:hypothetical protein